MNGYELSRTWHNWCFDNPDKYNSNHTAMFFWICEKWNRLGQKEKFGLPTEDSMEILRIKSKNTYYGVFNDLVEWGFIIVVQKSINQNTSTIISLNQKLIQRKDSTYTALDLATIQQKDSTVPIIEQTTIEPKTIEPKTINDSLFDTFWNLYDKKVDKKNTLKKWSKLKEETKQAIILHVPKYVAVTPDSQYRKNPDTYLNNCAWEDEIILPAVSTPLPLPLHPKQTPIPSNYQQPYIYYYDCLKLGLRPLRWDDDKILSDTELDEILKFYKLQNYAK
jgi:hypothetical protein